MEEKRNSRSANGRRIRIRGSDSSSSSSSSRWIKKKKKKRRMSYPNHLEFLQAIDFDVVTAHTDTQSGGYVVLNQMPLVATLSEPRWRTRMCM